MVKIGELIGKEFSSYAVRNMLIRSVCAPSKWNENTNVDLRVVGIAFDAAHTWIASLDSCQRSAIAANKFGGCVADQVISFWGWY